MPAVNGPDHLAYLLHRATQRLRAEAEAAAPPGFERLQAAQARLLDLIPAGGARVTDLARLMGVSKQALGQLVAHLAASGHVRIGPDSADARARVVHRTRAGDDLREAMRAAIAGVEQRWSDEVGRQRLSVVREVLAEIVRSDPSPRR